MRSCRDITALVSLSLEKKLSIPDRLATQLHLMICSRCRNFQAQTLFIRKAANRYSDHLEDRLSKKP